jgi:hypothetical protein
MIWRIVRVILGFIVACLAAGLTIVLFVYTPAELVADMATDRVSEAGFLSLAAATHSAVFAAPFALVGAAVGEWRGISSWTYYIPVGMLIAGIGFLVQYLSEGGGGGSILNSYALTAFLVTGFVAGLVYWLVSGRHASIDDDSVELTEISQPARPAPPPSISSARTAAHEA